MTRTIILLAGGVALAVTLGVNLLIPELRGVAGPMVTGAGSGLLDRAAEFGVPIGRRNVTALATDDSGPVYCEPDVQGFADRHDMGGNNMVALPASAVAMEETTILNPSRMNSYELSASTDYFVGYLAQRGSFKSVLFEDVGHIEVLTTYILRDASSARRNLTDSIRQGAGPTHGIFQVVYEQGDSLIGEWFGKTDVDGNVQGCFSFPPTRVNGKMTAGIGTYRQTFAQNDTSIVTWRFDAIYQSE